MFPTQYAIESTYVDILRRMSVDTENAAAGWYNDANAFAHELCNIRPDWSLEVASSVVSAFSPRERWESNRAKALMYAMGGTPRGLSNNLRMARDAERIGFAALRGRKTNAFARAIAGDRNAVVIDTWMLKPFDRTSITGPQYAVMECAVREVARMHLMDPRTAQAAIWIILRGSAL
jgi:hypothetical protein